MARPGSGLHRPGIVILALVVCQLAHAAREPTRSTHTGPWYIENPPATNELFRDGLPGQRLILRGAVYGTDGRPVTEAYLNLWHADASGEYYDTPFRALLTTGERGRFRLSTVMPGHRAIDRARHIHFVISHPDYVTLITRIYFLGDENIEYAIDKSLAVVVEQGTLNEETVLFANVEFVLRAR